MSNWNKTTKILIFVVFTSVFLIFLGMQIVSGEGTINVHTDKEGTSVFLDEKKVGISASDNKIITIKNVSHGEHSLLVHKKGYFPWEKTVRIYEDTVINIKPFSIRNEINDYTKKTNFTDDERAKINQLFNTEKTKRSFGGDGNVEIKRDENKIIAIWVGDELNIPDFFCEETICNKEILVMDSKSGTIKNIEFYPKRDDVILFSVGSSIFAIEIDKKHIQNFQPVWGGLSPSFAVDDANSVLYIKEVGSLVGLDL